MRQPATFTTGSWTRPTARDLVVATSALDVPDRGSVRPYLLVWVSDAETPVTHNYVAVELRFLPALVGPEAVRTLVESSCTNRRCRGALLRPADLSMFDGVSVEVILPCRLAAPRDRRMRTPMVFGYLPGR
jgi:hypothetical protein